MKTEEHLTAELCRLLGLKTIEQNYLQYAKTGHAKKMGYLEFLQMVLQEEANRKKENSIQYRLRESRLPRPYKLLKDYDFAFQPSLRESLIQDLASLEFIRQKESLLFIGDCGTGKSHLAQALGMIACEKGYKVHYVTCSALITDLNIGTYERNLAKHLKKYVLPDLLIIDEMGHDRLELQLVKEAHLLFKVVDERYRKDRSLVFTTNVAENQWAEYLGDPIATQAILDRIFHRSLRIEIKGPSYRQLMGKKLQKKYIPDE